MDSQMEDEILELQAERQHLLMSNRDILAHVEKREDKSLSDDEHRLIEDNNREAFELETKITNLQRTIEARRKVEKLTAEMREQNTMRDTLAAAGSRQSNGGTIETSNYYKTGQLRAFSNDVDAYNSGMWFAAKFLGNEHAIRHCKDKGIMNQMRAMENQRAMSEGVNTSGGHLVPAPMESSIIKLREEYGVFRRNAYIYPMASDSQSVPRRTGGVTIAIVGEGTAPSAQTGPTFDLVQLFARKAGGYVAVSSELNEDSVISIAELLADEFAYAFAQFEDNWGFVGDGSATYGGRRGIIPTVTAAGNTYKAFVDATAGIDSFGEVTAAELSRLMGRIAGYAVPNAKFYCSSTAYATIFERLAVSAGGNNKQDINGNWVPTYLGKPIEIAEVMFADDGATAAEAQPMLLYGDIRKCSTMGERRGITMKTSTEIKVLEDQIVVLGNERIDINCHDIGTTTVKGPIAVLYGNTA